MYYFVPAEKNHNRHILVYSEEETGDSSVPWMHRDLRKSSENRFKSPKNNMQTTRKRIGLKRKRNALSSNEC